MCLLGVRKIENNGIFNVIVDINKGEFGKAKPLFDKRKQIGNMPQDSILNSTDAMAKIVKRNN